MNDSDPGEVTQLLAAHRSGDSAAWASLIRFVYADLKRLARAQSGGRPRDRTLDTTSLVNECYLRLYTSASRGGVKSQEHFLSLAARIMRTVMCDYARERLAQKRGGGQHHAGEEAMDAEAQQEAEELLELDDLLGKLAAESARTAQVFECRYFGGLSEAQTVETLGLSLRTVQREWNTARNWLRGHIIKGTDASRGS
jgi:RNA polymerase sigma factor (TIGR02999 family)